MTTSPAVKQNCKNNHPLKLPSVPCPLICQRQYRVYKSHSQFVRAPSQSVGLRASLSWFFLFPNLLFHILFPCNLEVVLLLFMRKPAA